MLGCGSVVEGLACVRFWVKPPVGVVEGGVCVAHHRMRSKHVTSDFGPLPKQQQLLVVKPDVLESSLKHCNY